MGAAPGRIHERGFRFNTIEVVESLREANAVTGERADLKTGTQLYEAVLRPLCARNNIQVRLHTPRTRQEFLRVLRVLIDDAEQRDRGPILHIEAHGDQNGISLTSGERLNWEELVDSFTAINRATRLNLFVVMAACSGIHIQRVLHPLRRAPVWGVVGPVRDEVRAGDILERLRVFYEEFFRSFDGMAAVRAMNGTEDMRQWQFAFRSAEMLFRSVYSLHLRNARDPVARRASEDKIVAQLKSERFVSPPEEAMLRNWLDREIEQPRAAFENHRRPYFMIDLFPENEQRFPLTFDECYEE